MIERERRRLARMFRIALAAAAGPGAIAACDSSKEARDDAGAPAATGDASMAALDGAPTDASAGDAPGIDAYGLGGCYQRSTEVDAGADAPADAPDTCLYFYGCGLPASVATVGCSTFVIGLDGGLVPFGDQTCWVVEGQGCTADVYAPGEGGAVTMACTPCPTGTGRRPVGLRGAPDTRARSTLGAYLAAMAFEEGAAVHAFLRMRAELAAMRAPRALVRAAEKAEADERRHARTMTALAEALGGRPRRVRVRPTRPRSTAAVAIENAAEGCVRETYGALVLAWQASRAGDPELRSAFARIARDEARHAALSWALARWLDGRLDARARERVRRARERAIGRLAAETREPSAEIVRRAGVPTMAQGHALLASVACATLRRIAQPIAQDRAGRARARRSSRASILARA